MVGAESEFTFFGSAVLWMLLTFPAYWLFQWTVEGMPFAVWRVDAPQRPAIAVAAVTELSDVVSSVAAAADASVSVGLAGRAAAA
ncbi:MAG: hypothetical protein KDA41_07555 [Planctomycetales bacterium]|nr:hypothetical protein [Planctomycetales bacterium]